MGYCTVGADTGWGTTQGGGRYRVGYYTGWGPTQGGVLHTVGAGGEGGGQRERGTGQCTLPLYDVAPPRLPLYDVTPPPLPLCDVAPPPASPPYIA